MPIGCTCKPCFLAKIDGIKPYNILILFISLAYMAITIDITGVLKAAAFWVSNKGGTSVRRLFLYFYLMLTLLSVVLGNDPVILSGTAFLVYYTAAANLNPTAWLISEFAAANTASMVLFVGNPTNVVICEGFRVNNAAFTAYTILPFLACNLACYVALAFQFRDAKYLPRTLEVKNKLNVREVLRDPVSAWVGSILLGSCLIVIIIVSFFHVDVWKISLPFAFAKLVFDFAWDHCCYVTGRQRGGVHGGSDGGALADPMESVLKRAMSMPNDTDQPSAFASTDLTPPKPSTIQTPTPDSQSSTAVHHSIPIIVESISTKQLTYPEKIHASLLAHFPTFFTALPRLPFALIPFAFSQFILIEGLAHQGWIDVFANWLVRASGRQIHPTIWIIGVLGVVLCNLAGTNIGATILLTKVVRAAPGFPVHSAKAAAISLAVASNIGAVSFTFSASLAGLLWKTILDQKKIEMKQRTFAFWNMLPLMVMTGVGLAVVSAEMAVLY